MQTYTEKQLVDLIDKSTKNFSGPLDTLESAIGYLMIGRKLGWRAMFLIHSQSTIRNYEKILGINSKEFFPENGQWAKKSVAYLAVQKVSNYWKAVKGEIPGIRSNEALKN
ncbi:MAG: hypothetical protein KF771_11830 [Burkholderiales bacterium]|nr:hypothetical protein [Burkholderiales bacterium]